MLGRNALGTFQLGGTAAPAAGGGPETFRWALEDGTGAWALESGAGAWGLEAALTNVAATATGAATVSAALSVDARIFATAGGSAAVSATLGEGWRAAGRSFTASTDRTNVTSTAAISNHSQAGAVGVLFIGRAPAALGTNKFMAQKSTATATRGWTFLLDNLTVNGQLRALVGGTSYYDAYSSAANVVAADTDIAVAFSFKSSAAGTVGDPYIKLYRSLAQKAISEVSAYAGLKAGSGPGADSGDPIAIGNSNAGAQPFGGTGSWVIEFSTTPSVDDFRKAQQAALVCLAGDWARGLAMLVATTGFSFARFIANDGSVTDWTAAGGVTGTTFAAGSGQVTGTTAGPALDNDASGARLYRCFAPMAFEDDIETGPGTDNREQTFYRYTSGYAQWRASTAATDMELWGWQSFVDPTYAQLEVLGVWDLGTTPPTYLGTVSGGRTTAGLFSGTLSGLPAGTKALAVVNGFRSRAATLPSQAEPQQGTFVSFVYLGATGTPVAPVARTNAVVIIEDSILHGGVADPPQQMTAMQQYRRALPSYYDGVIHAGFGGSTLNGFTSSSGVQTAIVNRLVAFNPSRIVIELGANDKISSVIPAATAQTRLASLVDELLARGDWRSDGRIVLIAWTLTSTQEGNNTFGVGNAADNYRAIMAVVQSTRTARVDTHNLKGDTTPANIAADGVHIVNAGQTNDILPAMVAVLAQASPTMAATPTGTAAATAALTTSIRLAASPSAAASTTAALTTDIRLAASATGSANTTAALTTAIRLAAAPTGTVAVTAALTTDVRMAATATGTATPTAALTTSVRLAATATGSVTTTAALTTSVTLASSATGTASTTSALTTDVRLAATGASTASTTAALQVGARFAATAAGTAATTGALTTAITLAAAATGTAAVTAALAAATAFSATATGTAAVGAGLTTSIRLASSAAGASTVAAALTTSIALAASATGTAATTGALTTSIRLASTATGATSTTGALTTQILLASSAAGTASTISALATGILLAATGAATATANGTLQVGALLAAQGSAQAAATGALETEILLAASATGIATAEADLRVGALLAASAAGTATATATAATDILLQSATSGTASVAANLSTAIRLASEVTGTASVQAALLAGGQFVALGAGTATVAAALETSIALAATPTGSATATGTLQVGALLAAAPTGSVTATAALTTSIRLAATMLASATTAAALAVSAGFAASAAGTASASAALAVARLLAATATGSATTTAALQAGQLLAATATGRGTATAGLLATIRLAATAAGAATVQAAGLEVPAALAATALATATASADLASEVRLAATATGTAAVQAALAIRLLFEPTLAQLESLMYPVRMVQASAQVRIRDAASRVAIRTAILPAEATRQDARVLVSPITSHPSRT